MLSLVASRFSKEEKHGAPFILAERAAMCASHRPHRSSNELGTLVTTDLGCDARALRLSAFSRSPPVAPNSFAHGNLRLGRCSPRIKPGISTIVVAGRRTREHILR